VRLYELPLGCFFSYLCWASNFCSSFCWHRTACFLFTACSNPGLACRAWS